MSEQEHYFTAAPATPEERRPLTVELADAGSSFWRRQEILADLAAQVWRPAADSGLPTGAEKARYLVDFVERLWSEFEGACSRPAVDYALGCARRRADAHSSARAVLVHADIHAWNALRRPDGGYALVDPDGLLAEPEADLGILLREDPDHLLSGDPWAWTTWLARPAPAFRWDDRHWHSDVARRRGGGRRTTGQWVTASTRKPREVA